MSQNSEDKQQDDGKEAETSPYHDSRRRFKRGNPGRPKGSLGSMGEFQKALRAAETFEAAQQVVAALRKKALRGDPQAAKLYLERLAGRPRGGSEDDTTQIELPQLVDIASCRDAARIVVSAVAEGRLTLTAAQKLNELIATTLASFEAYDHEVRLKSLEHDLGDEAWDDD